MEGRGSVEGRNGLEGDFWQRNLPQYGWLEWLGPKPAKVLVGGTGSDGLGF